MKKLLILLGIVSCSTVSETPFLNAVKGKSVYQDAELTELRGSFSSDGKSFDFIEGDLSINIYKATSSTSAEYIREKTGVSTKYIFTLIDNNTAMTVFVEDGEPEYTLYIG